MIFNTCFGSFICPIGNFNIKDFLNCNFKLFGDNCTKIIITGQIIFQIMNYQVFQNNEVHLYEFFFLRIYVKTKIENIAKFQIIVLN
jgi:hypothetical protein